VTPFTSLEAFAAPVPIANVDTDMLVPAKFLKTISREGLAEALFYNLRGADPQFPLNHKPWDKAGILIGLENFGCGSSREHAPWALLDFGIRCVIARSFADIFYQNCFKNGILPIVLPDEHLADLMEKAADAATACMTVSLVEQSIVCAEAKVPFDIDPEKRGRLLLGLDDIELTLTYSEALDAFEQYSTLRQPWMPAVPQHIDQLFSADAPVERKRRC
jgi:3-isopropylmalate/(R)-2-methylmalate dehydratase small subunit